MRRFDLGENTPLATTLSTVALVATVLMVVVLLPAYIGFGIAGAIAASWCWLEWPD